MNGKISKKYIELATTNSSRRKRRRKKCGSGVKGVGGGRGGTGEGRRKRNGRTNTPISETYQLASQPASVLQIVRA
jgi:hypothetical protein